MEKSGVVLVTIGLLIVAIAMILFFAAISVTEDDDYEEDIGKEVGEEVKEIMEEEEEE